MHTKLNFFTPNNNNQYRKGDNKLYKLTDKWTEVKGRQFAQDTTNR